MWGGGYTNTFWHGKKETFSYFLIMQKNKAENLETHYHPKVTWKCLGEERCFQKVAEHVPGWWCGCEQQCPEPPTALINALDSWGPPRLLCGGCARVPTGWSCSYLPLGDAIPAVFCYFIYIYWLSSTFQQALSTKHLKTSKMNKTFFHVTNLLGLP